MKSELTKNDRRVLSMIAEELGDEWFDAERQLWRVRRARHVCLRLVEKNMLECRETDRNRLFVSPRLIMSEKVKEFRRRPGEPVPASVKTNDAVSEDQIKL